MSRFAPRPLTLSATLLVALTLGCHSRPETTASPGESSVPETAREEAPEAVEPPAMTQLEYKQCGEAAAAAYNESVDGAGADHLLEAARCFEGAGLMGLAIHVNHALIQRFPEHARSAADHNQRLYALLLDADVALQTPAGQACVAALDDPGSKGLAGEYIDAAQCLYGHGFVGAALRYRTLAVERPGPHDAAANEQERTRLVEMLARTETYASRELAEPLGR